MNDIKTFDFYFDPSDPDWKRLRDMRMREMNEAMVRRFCSVSVVPPWERYEAIKPTAPKKVDPNALMLARDERKLTERERNWKFDNAIRRLQALQSLDDDPKPTPAGLTRLAPASHQLGSAHLLFR